MLKDKVLLERLWHTGDHRDSTRRTGRAGRVSGPEEIVKYGSREGVGSSRLERRFADAVGSKGLLFDFGSAAAFAL